MSARGPDRALMALLVGFGLLVLACIGAVWLSGEQQRSAGWVNHSLEVENRIARVLSLLQDAETGQRGYLLTRRPEFLGPYNDAAPKLPGALADLRQATNDNPQQLALVERLDRVATDRAALLADILRSAPASRPFGSTQVEQLQRGKVLMDEARALVTQMKGYEDALLAERERRAQDEDRVVRFGLGLGAVAIACLGLFAFYDAQRRMEALSRARDEIEAANRQLVADADERERMEGQLRQMQKMEAVGQLTGGVAHDFNNMLAVIIGSLDLARRRLTGSADSRARAAIDNAMEGAATAAQLTSRLLAFSRQQALQPQPMDPNKLVAGMSELVRRTVLDDVKVETVLAGGLWRTSADSNQLESAILNLCINARDAMPFGGLLTIETANAFLDEAYAAGEPDLKPGQYVMIGVTDSGDGMTPEVLQRAFDPFYTTKGVGKGTGLGLSQVYGFVKQSGGHVKIYSEPGRGTTVKVYLPRLLSSDAAGPAPAPAAGPPRGSIDEIVLVVEDEARVREMSSEALRELGYTVIHASGAAEALERLAEEPRIALLFTDVVMPDVDGRRLAEKAREQRPELKVLFTTGFTRNAVVHNGVLDPGVAFLPKPFTVDQLARKVREALDAPA
jgi:signal transduction histidine kinase/CheY-like chemotaxis protein